MSLTELINWFALCLGPKTVFFWAPMFKWVRLTAYSVWVFFVFVKKKIFFLFLTYLWFHIGSGLSWLSRHGTSSRETQYLPICCADSHRYISRLFLKMCTFRSFKSHSLCFSGLIWSRYSLVIIPKNWNLFAVNFFVGGAGGSQLYRIWQWVHLFTYRIHSGVCGVKLNYFRLSCIVAIWCHVIHNSYMWFWISRWLWQINRGKLKHQLCRCI